MPPTIRDDAPRGTNEDEPHRDALHRPPRGEKNGAADESSDGRRLTIRLDDVLDARLRQASSDRGITPSEVAREALLAYLDERPTSGDDLFDVLDVLRRRAVGGNLTAAREVLRHERWEIDRADRGRQHFDRFADLDADDA